MIFNSNNSKSQQAPIGRLLMLMMLTLTSSCAFTPWEKPLDKTKTPETQVEDAKANTSKTKEETAVRKNILLANESAISTLITQAEQARKKELYAESMEFYERALNLSPDNSRAIAGKKELERELVQNSKIDKAAELVANKEPDAAKDLLHEVLMENPVHVKALELSKQIDAQQASTKNAPPQLKPKFDKPVSLELRDANIKVVFEALSRATGINFILDKEIKPDTKATIFVKKARIEDAIEMVLSSNGLQKKVLSDNTVLVFASTQAKLKDYQDLMIRSFYFTNTSAKQVSALLKTMLKTKDIFVDERLNMLIMRDTPEAIRIAEKLIAANDLEEPEVMLEIEVLEISRSRLQELGVELPSRVSVNSLIPITTVTSTTGALASSTVNTSTQLTLEGLLNLNKGRFDVSPNPALNFRKITGDVNLLSNPRIRVKNNEKAKILVGDKVPIITTTSTANVGISESVQYVDVGLTLNVEPRVTLDDFVNIKVGLEVSSLGEKTVTKSGTTVYTIGTRNANTALRLKNGETQILAGLILDDERKNASKLPGFGDIPLLGRLFSNHEDKKSKTEIVLAITPKILGNIHLPKSDISEYWSGTENIITDKAQVFVPASGNLSAKERFLQRNRIKPAPINTDESLEPSNATEPIEPVVEPNAIAQEPQTAIVPAAEPTDSPEAP
jgi:general secretion pathway protein D